MIERSDRRPERSANGGLRALKVAASSAVDAALAANWRRTTAPLSEISAAMKVSLTGPLLPSAPRELGSVAILAVMRKAASLRWRRCALWAND
jgi:hypothetical protein